MIIIPKRQSDTELGSGTTLRLEMVAMALDLPADKVK